MAPKIRALVADDERPARLFLIATLREFEEIQVVPKPVTVLMRSN